ncbi:hypothetical protein BSNK01_09030 [Bacillaceae bacterium]
MATWDLSRTKHHVFICNGSSCLRKGGEEVTQAIRREIAAAGMDEAIHTSRTRCNGRCKDACVVIVYPEGIWYKDVTAADAPVIVRQHLLAGTTLEEKVSHRYVNGVFVRQPGVEAGTAKSSRTAGKS